MSTGFCKLRLGVSGRSAGAGDVHADSAMAERGVAGPRGAGGVQQTDPAEADFSVAGSGDPNAGSAWAEGGVAAGSAKAAAAGIVNSDPDSEQVEEDAPPPI